jgi:thioredoxin 1
VLEFGTGWCGVCRRAQPLIAEVLVTRPEVARIKIEDGHGRRLGRLFQVKLWPTLVFLKDGKELTRVVRPQSVEFLKTALDKIVAA